MPLTVLNNSALLQAVSALHYLVITVHNIVTVATFCSEMQQFECCLLSPSFQGNWRIHRGHGAEACDEAPAAV